MRSCDGCCDGRRREKTNKSERPHSRRSGRLVSLTCCLFAYSAAAVVVCVNVCLLGAVFGALRARLAATRDLLSPRRQQRQRQKLLLSPLSMQFMQPIDKREADKDAVLVELSTLDEAATINNGSVT